MRTKSFHGQITTKRRIHGNKSTTTKGMVGMEEDKL